MMIQISSLESLMTYKSKESHKSNGMTYDLQLTPPMVIGVCKSYIRLLKANSPRPVVSGGTAGDGPWRDDLRTAASNLISAASRIVQSRTFIWMRGRVNDSL